MKITRTSRNRHQPKILAEGSSTAGFEHGSGAMQLSLTTKDYTFTVEIPVRDLLSAAGWAIADAKNIAKDQGDE